MALFYQHYYVIIKIHPPASGDLPFSFTELCSPQSAQQRAWSSQPGLQIPATWYVNLYNVLHIRMAISKRKSTVFF
eukprot:s2106_g9.t1